MTSSVCRYRPQVCWSNFFLALLSEGELSVESTGVEGLLLPTWSCCIFFLVSCWLSVVGCWFFWLSGVSVGGQCWLLIVGCWLLILGVTFAHFSLLLLIVGVDSHSLYLIVFDCWCWQSLTFPCCCWLSVLSHSLFLVVVDCWCRQLLTLFCCCWLSVSIVVHFSLLMIVGFDNRSPFSMLLFKVSVDILSLFFIVVDCWCWQSLTFPCCCWSSVSTFAHFSLLLIVGVDIRSFFLVVYCRCRHSLTFPWCCWLSVSTFTHFSLLSYPSFLPIIPLIIHRLHLLLLMVFGV
jgi:hypothetical protein